MGIFDFFKPKRKKKFSTNFGTFVLIDENGGLWVNDNDEDGIEYCIKGNAEMPDLEQVEFMKNIDAEILKLDEKINEKIIFLYQNESDLHLNFTHWKEKFSIFSYQIHKFEKKHIVWEFAMSKNHIDEPDVYLDFIFTIENGEIKNVSIDD